MSHVHIVYGKKINKSQEGLPECLCEQWNWTYVSSYKLCSSTFFRRVAHNVALNRVSITDINLWWSHSRCSDSRESFFFAFIVCEPERVVEIARAQLAWILSENFDLLRILNLSESGIENKECHVDELKRRQWTKCFQLLCSFDWEKRWDTIKILIS